MPRRGRVLGTRVPEEVLDAVHDCILALSGMPMRMTKARFVCEALEAHLKALTKKHNRGRTFPKTDGQLTPGRQKAVGGASKPTAMARGKRSGVARAEPTQSRSRKRARTPARSTRGRSAKRPNRRG